MDPEATVLAFIAAWNALDMERIYALMDDEIVYHNMPMAPVIGIDAVRKGFDSWPVDGCEWIVVNIATRGGVVLTERVDNFTRGEDHLSIPVMGTFEVSGGRITHWRDYFDMAALQPKPKA